MKSPNYYAQRETPLTDSIMKRSGKIEPNEMRDLEIALRSIKHWANMIPEAGPIRAILKNFNI
jgi:hypothetical protein